MEFAGAYVLCTGKQELYRKFLPRLNSVCMSQTRRRVWEPFGREFTSSAEAPARGTPHPYSSGAADGCAVNSACGEGFAIAKTLGRHKSAEIWRTGGHFYGKWNHRN